MKSMAWKKGFNKGFKRNYKNKVAAPFCLGTVMTPVKKMLHVHKGTYYKKDGLIIFKGDNPANDISARKEDKHYGQALKALGFMKKHPEKYEKTDKKMPDDSFIGSYTTFEEKK